MDTTEYTIIGVLDAISRNRTGKLASLLKYGDDKEPIRLGNVVDTFPKRGNVVWFHVPPAVEPWTLWNFRVRESPTFDPEEGRSDKYAVDGIPEQINDLVIGKFETVEEARSALERGVHLPIAPPRRPYVVVGGDRLIGPLELQVIAGRFILKPSATDPQVDVRTLNPDMVLSINHAGREWTFLFSAGQQSEILGQLDWGDDAAVLRRALRLVEKYDAARLQDVQLTDKVMRRLSENVAHADVTMLERSRIDRALQIVSKTIFSTGRAETFQAEILALPSVREMLDSDRERARAEGKQDALQNAAEQLERYRGELDSLRTDVTGLQQEKSKLETEIKRIRENQLRVADELDAELHKRIDEAAASPGKLLADLVLLRPFLRHLGAIVSSKAENVNPAVVPCSALECDRIIDEATLHNRADVNVRAAGFCVSLGRSIHAALLAGLVPCVMGEAALELVQAYASSLFCGAVLEVTMNAGLISPEQVLEQGSVYQLRSFLHHARQSDLMHLVIFEGVNRSLVDSSLIPLLRAASVDNALAQTFGSWPANVLCLVTLCPSVANLRIPDAFWDLVAIIDTSAEEPRPAAPSDSASDKKTPCSLVEASFWREWVTVKGVPPGRWRGWLEKKIVIRSPFVTRRADRFEAAMRKLENDEVRIVGTTLACCFGAVIARLGEKEKEAVVSFPTFKEKLQVLSRDILKFLDIDER